LVDGRGGHNDLYFHMKEILIEQASSKEKMGNKGKYWLVGIKTGGKWYNGFINQESDLKLLKQNSKVSLIFFQTEHEGKTYDNFKLPGKNDLLEQRVATLEKVIKGLIKQNDLKYEKC